MFQEFFPILDGAPMGDLWILLFWGFFFMIGWMLLMWAWQWKRQMSGMENVGWCSGLVILVLFDALKADGYVPRRFLIAVLVMLSSGFLAGRFWVTAEPAEPSGIRGLFYFECRTILVIFLSLPMVLLVTDPLPAITGSEWMGLLIWVIGMGGQIVATNRQSFFEWLIWVSYFVAALSTPYGGWTILCPLVMLVLLKPFKRTAIEELPADE